MVIVLRRRSELWYRSRNFTGRIVEDVLVTTDQARPPGTLRGGQDGRTADAIRCSSQSFDGLSWVPKHLGALASVESPRSKHLVAKAFRLESHKSLREIHAYGHTGWIEVEGRGFTCTRTGQPSGLVRHRSQDESSSAGSSPAAASPRNPSERSRGAQGGCTR